jgi:CPA1 family monovalent cation:H+ antiporter
MASLSQSTLLLLLIAALTAMVTRRLRLPYSTGLVVAGIVLVFLPVVPPVLISSQVIYSALLPPLLFEAAFYLRWNKLRRELAPVLSLAVGGFAIACFVTAAGMHYAAGWPWNAAFIFGALIAATDPVSVLATFREAGAHGRLSLLIEAESLLNDGVAAVAFAVAVAVATGASMTPVEIGLRLVVSVGIALASGAAVGGIALLLMGPTNDHLVELTFTTLAAFGSFLAAERFHASGVLAVIVAGLMMGNIGPLGALSNQGRVSVRIFWEYAAFVANSLVFLLIGIYQARMYRTSGSMSALTGLIAVAVVLGGRAVSVYLVCGALRVGRMRVKPQHQHALVWGGLRGALALALALGLPDGMSYRAEIVATSFIVVAFSIFAQGLTIGPLLHSLGELTPEAAAEAAD